MIALVTRADQDGKSAGQLWLETVEKHIIDIGWPGEMGELALLILGVALFLLQFKIFIERAFFSESGVRATGVIVDVGEQVDRLARAEITFHSKDGRKFMIADRGPYLPEDKGDEVMILYAQENPQRAKVRKPSAAAAKQFLVGGAAAAACAIYGYLPVLNAPPGG